MLTNLLFPQMTERQKYHPNKHYYHRINLILPHAYYILTKKFTMVIERTSTTIRGSKVMLAIVFTSKERDICFQFKGISK